MDGRACSQCVGTRNLTLVEIDRSNHPDIPEFYLCEDCIAEIEAHDTPPEILSDWAPIEEDGLRLEWMACTSWVLGTGDVVVVVLRRPGGTSTCAMNFRAGTVPTEEHALKAIAVLRDHLPQD